MIKLCKVISVNPATIVVSFDGKLIQFPFKFGVKDRVYVKETNETYTIVSKQEYEEFINKTETNITESVEELSHDTYTPVAEKKSVKKRKK